MTGLESRTVYLPPILSVRSRPLSADQTQGEVNKLHLSKGGVSEASRTGLKTNGRTVPKSDGPFFSFLSFLSKFYPQPPHSQSPCTHRSPEAWWVSLQLPRSSPAQS